MGEKDKCFINWAKLTEFVQKIKAKMQKMGESSKEKGMYKLEALSCIGEELEQSSLV